MTIVRRTLVNAYWSSLFLIAFLGVFVVPLAAEHIQNDIVRKILFDKFAMVWHLVFCASAGLFAWLQLRGNHPAVSTLLGDWVLGAGWDGLTEIDGFAVRLHWFDIATVAGFSLAEAALLQRFALGTMVGWITIRLLVFGSICLSGHNPVCYPPRRS